MKKCHRYVLNEQGEPVPEPDLMTWAFWIENHHPTWVAQELIGEARVSTIFLGYDASFDTGMPILWETMVFGGPLDEEQDRCTGNREQAEAMHEEMCARVRAELAKT